MKTYKTLFFGTPDFAVPALNSLIKMSFLDIQAVITQPDAPVGKNQIITAPPVKKFALYNKLEVLQPSTLKSNTFKETLKQYQPDIIIIIAYGKIIPKDLLSIPKFGWLNIHGSLLPKYRGASPIQAVLLSGDEKTGVTLMKIDEGLDTGPIISQKEININYTDNFETLHDKLSELGGEILDKDLKSYLSGKLIPYPQGKSTTPVTKTIKKEDGKINWENSAEFIDRQIRAYSPWPGTYTFWRDKRIIIIDAEIVMLPSSIQPGSIFVHGDKYYVGAKKNAIKLNVIQMAGKKELDIKSFIKGQPNFIKAILK